VTTRTRPKVNALHQSSNEKGGLWWTSSTPWRMNDKWSGNSFLLGFSCLANHDGYLSCCFYYPPTNNLLVARKKSNWDNHHGLARELKPNRKLFPDHLPFIPHGVLVVHYSLLFHLRIGVSIDLWSSPCGHNHGYFFIQLNTVNKLRSFCWISWPFLLHAAVSTSG